MKISIIGGAGRVGSSIAFSLLHQCKIDELVLIDISTDAVKGEALDLSHATVAVSPKTKVSGTDDTSEIKDSDIVIIVAGKARTPEMKREELLDFNKKIVEGISKEIVTYAPDSYVVVVTNPSTIMGRLVKEITNFPPEKIIVMDNQLDTARLKYYISKETGKDVNNIKSKVAGEHGENMEFIIKDDLTPEQVEKVNKETLEAGISVISLKKYTSWGIASQVVQEVKKIEEKK